MIVANSNTSKTEKLKKSQKTSKTKDNPKIMCFFTKATFQNYYLNFLGSNKRLKHSK